MNYFSCRWSWFGIIITLLEDQLKRNLLLDQNRIFNTQCFSLDFLTLCFKLLILSFLLTGTMVRLWYQLVFLGRPNLKLFFFFLTWILSPFNWFYCSLPALHQKFDLPAPFVLHTDCPHYWRFHLPGCHLTGLMPKIFF